MKTIVAAAVQLQIPLSAPDGSARISGHSLRVSGAQGLTRIGYPTWAVQLLGRWGSDTVRGYIGDAALEVFTEGTPRAGVGVDSLDVVLAAAGRSSSSSSSSSAPPRPTAERPGRRTEPASVEQLIARIAGDMFAELGGALRAEVSLEIARMRPRPTATTDAATDPEPTRVMNDRTECIHLVGIGTESGLASKHWQSLCGWAFGRWGGYTVMGGAQRAPTCERCLEFSLKRPAGKVGVDR